MNTLDSIARQIRVRPVVVWAALLVMNARGGGEESGVSSDFAVLHRELQAVRQELADLSRNLDDIRGERAAASRSREPATRIVSVPVRDRPVLGDTNAPLVLVAFTDSRCLYSRAYHETVLPGLREEYVDTGQLQIVSRTCALDIEGASRMAAQCLLGAGALGKYWEMQTKLFAHEGDLTRGAVIGYAQTLGIDIESMKTALDTDRFIAGVLEDKDDARAAGIRGTPAFVLGTRKDDAVTGERLEGVVPLSVFDARIRALSTRQAPTRGRFGIQTIGVGYEVRGKP